MQHINDLTDEQKHQIATCLMFFDHQITAILGGTSQIVFVIHPDHVNGEECKGLMVSGNVGAEAAKHLMLKGADNLDPAIEAEKLNDAATHDAPSTAQ